MTVRIGQDCTASVDQLTQVRGAVVPSGPVTVKGSVFDALSEPTVRCEGVPAVVSENREFECIVSIASGTTTIAVDARDTAGNTITTGITLTTTDAVIEEPTSLRITPQNVTLTNGEERRFRVVDDRGRVPTDAVWSIDNSTMATLAGPNDPRVTGVSAGQVTLTVTWRGLSASTEIDILGSGGVLTPGATLWSAPPIRGAVDQIVQASSQSTAGGRSMSWNTTRQMPDIIRAFDVDGGEVWSIPTQGRVTQLSGDPFGGVVALVDTTITRYTADGMGFTMANDAARGFAINSAGTIYYASPTASALIGGFSVVPLPTPEGPMGWVDVGIPTVLEDDRVALPIYVRNTAATPSRYQLLLHTPGGGTALHTLGEGQETNGTWVNPYKAVPNGLGGFLVLSDVYQAPSATIRSGLWSREWHRISKCWAGRESVKRGAGLMTIRSETWSSPSRVPSPPPIDSAT